ncbi:MAG: hypothetical protein ABI467_28370 [Kofleriaceae bacterium]
MTEGNVPRAVASGIAAPPSTDAVSAHRTGVVIGVLAAAVISALFAVRELPGRALALVGGASSGVARYGGVVATYTPPPGVEPKLGADSEHGDNDVRIDRRGDHWTIELPHVTEAQAPAVIARLAQGGGLEFREVIESRAAAELEELGLAFDDRDTREPTIEVDQWRPEDGGPVHDDVYLHAFARDTLVHAFAEAQRHGWTPPPHTTIVYEQTEPIPDAKDRRTGWRSYFVADEAALDGSAIANATGTYDPSSHRPVVSLEFTRHGARVFGDLTARITGHKLAMLLGGEVKSAPIINSAIHGGRAQITMGANDPRTMESERDALVETLKTGGLALGGQITGAQWVAPTGGGRGVLARLLLALLAGGLGYMLAFGLVRGVRPERRHRAELAAAAGTGGTRLVPRLAWTAFAILVYIAGTWISAPGLNRIELDHVIYAGRALTDARPYLDAAQFSIFALGVMPLLTAFVTVEILASIVRPWRALRDTVAGRRKLGTAVAIGAVLIAAVQAYFVVTYLEALDRGGAEIFDPKLFWPCVATLAAAPMVLAVLASLISTRGLGNGYAVIFVAAWLWSIPWFDLPAGATLVLAVVIVAATVAITLGVLGWRVRAPGRVAIPLPASSIAPLHDGGALALIGTLTALGVAMPRWVIDHMATLRGSLTLGLVVLAIATVLWAFALTRPGRRRAELAAAKLEPADRSLWLRAVAISIAALAALFGLALIRPHGGWFAVCDPAMVVIAAATLADLVEDARVGRRAKLVPVWPLHDPLLVDAAREILGDLPHFIQSTRLRTLLSMFGSYVPMVVLVPEAHAAEAHARLRDWLTPR